MAEPMTFLRSGNFGDELLTCEFLTACGWLAHRGYRVSHNFSSAKRDCSNLRIAVAPPLACDDDSI